MFCCFVFGCCRILQFFFVLQRKAVWVKKKNEEMNIKEKQKLNGNKRVPKMKCE
jgi:hypothetical protein